MKKHGVTIERVMSNMYVKKDDMYEVSSLSILTDKDEHIVRGVHFKECYFHPACCSYKYVDCIFEHCEGMDALINDGASAVYGDINWMWNTEKSFYLVFDYCSKQSVLSHPDNKELYIEVYTEFSEPYDRWIIQVGSYQPVMYSRYGDPHLRRKEDVVHVLDIYGDCRIRVLN